MEHIYLCSALSWRQPWVMLSRSSESSRVCSVCQCWDIFTFSTSYCSCCGNSWEEHGPPFTSMFAHCARLYRSNFVDASRSKDPCIRFLLTLCWKAAQWLQNSVPFHCPSSRFTYAVFTFAKAIIAHFSGNWGEVEFHVCLFVFNLTLATFSQESVYASDLIL